MVDHLQQDLPARFGQRLARLPTGIGRLHQLSIHIELHLVDRGVSDPYRLRSTVPLELVENEFREAVVTVDPVHDLEVLGVPVMRHAHPAQEAVCLVPETHFAKGVDHVGRVSYPAIPVVPVQRPARAFGQ